MRDNERERETFVYRPVNMPKENISTGPVDQIHMSGTRLLSDKQSHQTTMQIPKEPSANENNCEELQTKQVLNVYKSNTIYLTSRKALNRF